MAAAVKAEPFMNGTTSMYIEQMYAAWQTDPSSVHISWDAYFRNIEAGAGPGQAFQSPPVSALAGHIGAAPAIIPQPGALAAAPQLDASIQTISDHLKIQLLIRSYQTRGHNIADLDPLGINSADLDDTIPPELELSFYGFGERDLDREFLLPPTTFITEKQTLTLREIIKRLKEIYCNTTGIEYMHLNNLVAIVDRNYQCTMDFTEDLLELEPVDKKFEAFGWDVKRINGHDLGQLYDALRYIRSRRTRKPTAIIADTVKGEGIEGIACVPLWHGSSPIKQEDVDLCRRDLEKSRPRTK